MRQVKRTTVVYAEVPEETLTEWAVAGDLEALTELHHREAGTAARFAAVVSGRPEEAQGVVAAAFRTALTELSDGDAARDVSFLPRLLRSARSAALVDAADRGVDAHQLARCVAPGTSPELLAELFSGLTEPERSALWLAEVAGLSPSDASIALAVSGGTSTLRWTRARSAGSDALVERAYGTLGDHRTSAILALAGVEAVVDEHHIDTIIAGSTPNRVHRWTRPEWARADWITSAIRSDRDKSVGRMVRLAAILVVVLGLLGLLFGRHDAGTAQTIDRAGQLQVLGSNNVDRASTTDAGPATGGNSSSSSPGGRSNGNASTSPQTSATGGSDNGSGGTQPKPIVGSTSNRLGLNIAGVTTIGVGSSSTTTTRSGQPGQPTSTTPTSGSGPGPGPTNTQAPQSTPTTVTSATTATTQPPTTPTTAPTTTTTTTTAPTTTATTAAPPTTDPTTTVPPTTTEPTTTVPPPPPTTPPSTLPPLP